MIDDKKDLPPEKLEDDIAEEDLDDVSGGINPQPLPPGIRRASE